METAVNLSHRTSLTLLMLAAVAAAPPAPRVPTARWVVNYDDAQCVATRSYGTEEKPLFLALKASPMQTVVRVMLIRKGLTEEAQQRPAHVQFGEGKPISVNALSYSRRESRHYVAAMNLPMRHLAASAGASTIAIKGASFDERLAVPGLSGVVAAFDDCLAGLRDAWNVGEAYSARIKQPAQAIRPLRDLFGPGLYPTQAMREGNAGAVGLSLLVDETGKVRDCMVEETSGFATLDTMSCQILVEDAKFRPAMGAGGKPVKSAFFQRINWKIRP